METQTMENSQPSTNRVDGVPPDDHNDVSQPADTNGGGQLEPQLSAEEVKHELEIIASTGKFWHVWDELKTMLSFQLKQVLSEYPEATKGDDQHNSSLGESYPDLVKRLQEALFSFTEGPPFTLQRLCEILLSARIIYPNLSKLALALEKNLLVTSTLTRSTDFYPPSTEQPPNTHEEQNQDSPPQPPPETLPHSDAVENGTEPITDDRDEEMTQVDNQTGDCMAVDMETFQEIISSEANPERTNNSL